MTETLVAKVLISKAVNTLQATGIQLANGTQILGKAIILSTGAIHTPQILKLSGIGPAEELTKRNISVMLDAPEVGENFVDHGPALASWSIKDPEDGWAPGSGNPLFNEVQYSWGSPTDFITSTTVTRTERRLSSSH